MTRLSIAPDVARRVVERRWPGDDFASRVPPERLVREVASHIELAAKGITHDERTVDLYWEESVA